MKNVKTVNQKSVSFRVKNFCVPTQKKSTQKHTIYAGKNAGYTAVPQKLGAGLGVRDLALRHNISGLVLNVQIGNLYDGAPIKTVFCCERAFSIYKNNYIYTVTDGGMYYSILGAVITRVNINHDPFIAFAHGRCGTNDYVFGCNSSGVYGDRNITGFKKIANFAAHHLFTFDNRLFVVDADGVTLHFSVPLDMMDF